MNLSFPLVLVLLKKLEGGGSCYDKWCNYIAIVFARYSSLVSIIQFLLSTHLDSNCSRGVSVQLHNYLLVVAYKSGVLPFRYIE